MRYDFKLAEELLWAGFVAAGIFFLEALVAFDTAALDDPQAYVLGILGGALRAFGGAALAIARGR